MNSLWQLLAHIRILLDESDQAILDLQVNACAVLNLLVESTIAFNYELLAWYRWVGNQVDIVDVEDVVCRVFAEGERLAAWDLVLVVESFAIRARWE